MIKLLIVDDEALIRQGIRQGINWVENDIQVIGESSNGEDALKKIYSEQPDIILTDIRMPIMSGLELIEKLKPIFPEIKIIILSAYSETEYLTKAISLGVDSYVFKNANASDILSEVLKAKEAIIRHREKQVLATHISSIIDENKYLIQTNLFERFITHKITYDEFIEKAAMIDLKLCGPEYALILTKNSSCDNWRLINELSNCFSSNSPFIWILRENVLAIILNQSVSSSLNFHNTILAQSLFEFTVFADNVTSIAEFPKLFLQLELNLARCCWHEDGKIFPIDLSLSLENDITGDLLSEQSRIISFIINRDFKGYQEALENYFLRMKSLQITEFNLKDCCTRLAISICSALEYYNITDELVSKITLAKTALDIKSILLDIKTSFFGITHSQIEIALDYIEKNFNKDITLEDVAKATFMSQGYLSRTFKSKTGYPFKEWLHRVRISKAKELLKNTDMKYYEIAERIGYKDYKHFWAYFNKFCGCSAKEYKQQYRV